MSCNSYMHMYIHFFRLIRSKIVGLPALDVFFFFFIFLKVIFKLSVFNSFENSNFIFNKYGKL